jgi:predicted Rossmann fold flavoprotein
MLSFDVIIIGAGAAGMMCAIEAGKRGRKVLLLEHSRKPGNKILMAGGGRCNFTNINIDASNFISHNPHFCKSALSRYTQWDFIAMVNDHNIPYHERDHGQLFCKNSSKDILDMLRSKCNSEGVEIHVKTSITKVATIIGGFNVHGENQIWKCESLVIATGGLSIPTSGATPFGYQIAEQFGIKVWPPSAGLVPFTLKPEDKKRMAPLSGISVEVTVSCNGQSFRENILFTHRGLSGPAILQISNYWYSGQNLSINWLPNIELDKLITATAKSNPKQQLKTIIATILPQRLVPLLIDENIAEKPLNQLTNSQINNLTLTLKSWQIKPAGTEGYRTAEVTQGGVDCDSLSSKTMETKTQIGLYFIGEVIDVAGWLGGYNLQWAWSSGWCAGQYV